MYAKEAEREMESRMRAYEANRKDDGGLRETRIKRVLVASGNILKPLSCIYLAVNARPHKARVTVW